MIVPRINIGTDDKPEFGPLVFDSWGDVGSKINPDGETYTVTLQGPRFIIDRHVIPADGETHAVARYASVEDVYWVVDGVPLLDTPVDGWAELHLSLDAPGTVTVQIEEHSFVIVGVEP